MLIAYINLSAALKTSPPFSESRLKCIRSSAPKARLFPNNRMLYLVVCIWADERKSELSLNGMENLLQQFSGSSYGNCFTDTLIFAADELLRVT